MTSHEWWRHLYDDVIFNILCWLLFVIFVTKIWYNSQIFTIMQHYCHYYIIQQLIHVNIFYANAINFDKQQKNNNLELWRHQWRNDDAMHLSANKLFYSSQARSQKSAMKGLFWGSGGGASSRRRLEIWGQKPPAAVGTGVWGRSPQRSKILRFFAKIAKF